MITLFQKFYGSNHEYKNFSERIFFIKKVNELKNFSQEFNSHKRYRHEGSRELPRSKLTKPPLEGVFVEEFFFYYF